MTAGNNNKMTITTSRTRRKKCEKKRDEKVKK